MNIMCFGTGMEIMLGQFTAGWLGVSLAPSATWEWRQIYSEGGRSIGYLAVTAAARRWSSISGHRATHTSWFRTSATPVSWREQ